MKKTAGILTALLIGSLLGGCNLPQGASPTALAATVPTLHAPATLTPTSHVHLVLTGMTPGGSGFLSTQPVDLLTPSSTPGLPQPIMTLTPRRTPTTFLTLTPSVTPIPPPGTIAGDVSGYPYGAVPALAIVAYGQNPPNNYSYLLTAPGSTHFIMSTEYLLPGPYQVVAYDTSGNSGGCPGFVTVISNQTVTCTISDWASTYRSKPSGVPNP